MIYMVEDLFRKLAVSNIYLYQFVRKRLAHMSFMLPHDRDFFGLAKFGDGDGLFLDVGGNDGISARSYRKLVKRRPIHSIEANTLHIESLENIKNSLSDFDYTIMGASDENGSSVLYTPIYCDVALTNYSSMSEKAARDNLTKHMRIRDIGEKVDFVASRVSVKRIDALDLSLPLEIMKIDVEGFEDAVLRGAERTIANMNPVIMVEYNPRSFGESRQLLEQYDYAFASYDSRTGRFARLDTIQHTLNVFCLPRKFHHMIRPR